VARPNAGAFQETKRQLYLKKGHTQSTRGILSPQEEKEFLSGGTSGLERRPERKRRKKADPKEGDSEKVRHQRKGAGGENKRQNRRGKDKNQRRGGGQDAEKKLSGNELQKNASLPPPLLTERRSSKPRRKRKGSRRSLENSHHETPQRTTAAPQIHPKSEPNRKLLRDDPY